MFFIEKFEFRVGREYKYAYFQFLSNQKKKNSNASMFQVQKNKKVNYSHML